MTSCYDRSKIAVYIIQYAFCVGIRTKTSHGAVQKVILTGGFVVAVLKGIAFWQLYNLKAVKVYSTIDN